MAHMNDHRLNQSILPLYACAVLACAAGVGCWTGPHWPEVKAATPQTLAPPIAIVSKSNAQRDAFCRVFRESGQFSDVDCTDEPQGDITLTLRYTTISFEHRIGEAIGYGLLSLLNCIFLTSLEFEHDHRGILSYRGKEAQIAARGRGAMMQYMCFPGAGALSLLGTVWAPPLSAVILPTWDVLEQKCADAPVVSVGVAVSNVGIASTQRDRSACLARDRFLSESSANAAVASLPKVLKQIEALTATSPEPSSQVAADPHVPARGRRKAAGTRGK